MSAVLLERRVVGRKTPKDGRLELLAASADRLEALGEGFTVLALGRQAAGRIEAMACTCGKGGNTPDQPHVHRFAVCPLFQELTAGAEVCIELIEERAALRVEPA